MRFQKLTEEERKIKRFRHQRACMVGWLMQKDKSLTSAEALKIAEKYLRRTLAVTCKVT